MTKEVEKGVRHASRGGGSMRAGETGNYQHAVHERLPGARSIWGYGGRGLLYDDRQEKKGILTLVYGVMRFEDRGGIKMRGRHGESGRDRA